MDPTPPVDQPPDFPGVDPEKLVPVTFKQSLCLRHGEPFRREWPKGYIVYVLEGVSLLLQDPDLYRRIGTDPRRVGEILNERPLCCLLPEEDLMACYRKSGVGKQGRCDLCKGFALGTPYGGKIARSKDGPEERIDFRHLCFWCIIKNILPKPPPP